MSENPQPSRAQATRQVAVPFILGVAALGLFLGFRHQIVDWFMVGRSAHPPTTAPSSHREGGAHGDTGAAIEVPSLQFGPQAKAAAQRVLAAYEAARQALAADSVSGLDLAARELDVALPVVLRELAGVANAEALVTALEEARASALLLGADKDVAIARDHFAALSQALVALVRADPSLSHGLYLFECTMTKGYNRWLQPQPQIENPYQGSDMLSCGDPLDMSAPGAGPVADATLAGKSDLSNEDIAHYTCPMDTWVRAEIPGACPVCGMDLVPVTEEEVRTGVMRIDHRRRQLIGLRTGLVERRELTANIQAIGRVVYDESRQSEVVLKYDGFIDKLSVNATGQYVKRGQVLFTVYSPELYAAQQEYLLAVRQRDAVTDAAARARADALVAGAAQRLSLWDFSASQLSSLRSRGTALENVAVLAPASGYVIEKFVVAGAAVRRGERLFRIAALDKVWIEADVYERDIPHVKVGEEALVTLTHLPGKSFAGKVSFIYPYLDGAARTARARIELSNSDLELKPDMYADVELRVPLGERLLVPESAVIYSGPRRIVFLDLDKDRLRPQEIQVGVKSNGYFEVISGLAVGDRVVTSGNFLLSAESRLKSATGLW